MEHYLGTTMFITWSPPSKTVKVGNIKISAGNGVMLFTKTTNSSSQSSWPTVVLEYGSLNQGELSLWVLFHAFITGNPWTLPSYMGTIYGVVEPMDKPLGEEKNYDDFLNIAYRTEGITQKMSYSELYDRFISLNEQQNGMVKNLSLDMKPGLQWTHQDMADYSYWRMVIDYSIVDAIIGRQSFCSEVYECSKCHKTKINHYSISAEEWIKNRLTEIIGDTKKVDQYMKIIWTVRENIRHKTAHESAYPYQRPSSQLQPGDNEFDINTVVSNFKTDTHALTALESNMHEITRILLLDNILQTKIFPDIRPYMVRSGGMSWNELMKVLE
ncbi:MAG: hypothetical protein PHU35_01830 [Bacteroidales bacterium]|nr:hypothetical protein [Bacteroidales bacterium]